MIRLVSLSIVLAFFLATNHANAEDAPEFLSFQVGGFDVNDDDTTALLGVEYRSDYTDLIQTPMAGGFITAHGDLYGYGGVFIDLFLGDSVVLRPNFSVGAYSDGGGKDLGGLIEFRSAIELAWRFHDHSRLGIEISHLSNNHIYDKNPGTEILTVNYSMPLDQLF